MYCLNCGWCCEQLSPFTEDESIPCPHLIERDDMKLCGIYEHRPKQCKDHDFPAKICPVGRDVLNLSEEEAIERIKRNDWILYATEERMTRIIISATNVSPDTLIWLKMANDGHYYIERMQNREHLKPDRFSVSSAFAERLQMMPIEDAWKEMDDYIIGRRCVCREI